MINDSRPFQVRLARRVFFASAVELSKDIISGHNYILEAYVTGKIDEESGMIFSIRKLDELLTSVTRNLDHKFLNRDVEFFKTHPPTPEYLSKYCFDELIKKLEPWPEVNLCKVRLFETDDLWVDYGLNLVPEL